MAQALESLGVTTAERGDYPRAQRHLEESVGLFREVGDQRAIGNALFLLGGVTFAQRDNATARLNWNESLAIARELRSQMRIGVNVLGLGLIARVEGHAELSHACLEESVAIARDIGARWLTGLGLASRGWVARSEGNKRGARAYLHEALHLLRDTAHHGGMTSCLLLTGVLAVDDSTIRQGVRLLARADMYRVDHELRVVLLPQDHETCDQSIAAARASLSDDDFARAWAEGQAMTLEQAVAYALAEEWN
jgi:tetratricopeptide (TPR) repeat protein